MRNKLAVSQPVMEKCESSAEKCVQCSSSLFTKRVIFGGGKHAAEPGRASVALVTTYK